MEGPIYASEEMDDQLSSAKVVIRIKSKSKGLYGRIDNYSI